MDLELFEITARNKHHDVALSEFGDFELSRTGRITETEVLNSPDWTLYCLDLDTRRAMLLELPEGSDLSQATFVFARQFADARRAALMPFDRLIATARAIKPPAHLAFLFSTARCGSTLASRIFAQIPEVWSLSEPEYLTNIAVGRRSLGRGETAELVRAATLWTCRPPRGRTPETIVIKPRSEAILVAEACHMAFPDSRSVFMYRDLIGFANSLFRFVQRVDGPDRFFGEKETWRPFWNMVMVGAPIDLLDDVFPPDHGPVGFEEFATLMWDLRIDGYLRALRRGMDFTAIHYEDLNQDRANETARLLAGCGVSVGELERAMAGFIEDSHKGSFAANAIPARGMNADEAARATSLLARLGRRDYVDARLPE